MSRLQTAIIHARYSQCNIIDYSILPFLAWVLTSTVLSIIFALLKFKLMKKLFLLTGLIALCCLVSQCKKEETVKPEVKSVSDYDGLVTQEWFKLECTIVKETAGFFPPQAARAFGYTGIALYESIAQGWKSPVSLTGQLNGFSAGSVPAVETGQEYHWGIVANYALGEIIKKMFEQKISKDNLNRIFDLETKWYDKFLLETTEAIAKRSKEYGNAVALAIFEYSKTDGGHESYVDPFQLPYTWPKNNGAWVPTSATLNPLAPRWASNRPFLNANITEGQPAAHTAYSTVVTSEFYKEAMQVYNTVTNATSEQKEIAKFWADDPFNTCTPTGHTFNIMTQLLEENNANLGTCAIGYAKLAIAENDAFIACWKTKYDYFLIRPVSYIKQNIDASFATVIGTPPFPAYTSGHATEAAAGARIFTDMFTDGDGFYPFTDRTQLQFGFSVRNFDNFNQMAEECANSRLYGGIHYNTDNLNGLKMGRSIGDNVNKKIQWPE